MDGRRIDEDAESLVAVTSGQQLAVFAVEVEVGHIGRNKLRVAAVVAANGNRNLSAETLPAERRAAECFHGFGDVCLPLVVTTHVRSDSGGIDIYLCLLSRAFKLQAGASVGIGILYVEHGAIPAGALIIVHIRVNGVFRIEAVGQGDFLPEGNGFGLSCSGNRAHHFPNASHILADKLPMLRKTLLAVGRNQCVCLQQQAAEQ